MPPESSTLKPRPPISSTFDALIERAFAPKATPDSTPRLKPSEARKSFASVSTIVPEAPPEVPDPESKLLEIWEQVREKKATQLEALPSKVKSLEVIPKAQHAEGVVLNRTLTKKKSMVTFKESQDRDLVTATFEMGGVKKQDMHVSYRVNRIVVTWRRTRIVERMEGSVKVRDRQEKQYNQIIPIPEGTKFDDIRATRDGRRLILTYPNFKGAAKEEPSRLQEQDDVEDPEPMSPCTAASGETEFLSCLPE